MLWIGQWKPPTPILEFYEAVTTALQVQLIQQGIVMPATIQPIAITPMVVELHFT